MIMQALNHQITQRNNLMCQVPSNRRVRYPPKKIPFPVRSMEQTALSIPFRFMVCSLSVQDPFVFLSISIQNPCEFSVRFESIFNLFLVHDQHLHMAVYDYYKLIKNRACRPAVCMQQEERQRQSNCSDTSQRSRHMLRSITHYVYVLFCSCSQTLSQ